MADEVKHYQVGTKYRIAIKRADTKGIDGFTVEASGDDINSVSIDADTLCEKVKELTKFPEVKE